MRQAAVGGIETSGKAMTGPTVRGSLNLPILVGRPQRPVHQLCLHLLLPITSITTKRPSAKEPMSCTKKCNQLNGPRKSGLAGRDITDIRAYELSHPRSRRFLFFGSCPKDVIKVSFGPGVAQSRCS